MSTVGVVSPGAMGSALGHVLLAGGTRVLATLDGRSERTTRLAARTAIEQLPDLEAVVREADIVLSVVAPEAAEAVVTELTETARRASVAPLIVDLNATAPATAERMAASSAGAGCDFVDGSISGPPPWKAGTTRIYLSGERAREVSALPFDGVERIVVGDAVGAASAVKMSTASVYKGTTAVLAQALLAADANEVLEHVLADLRLGAPELVSRVERRIANATAKSGRYVGEMREIAASQSDTGLTPTLFQAMGEIYAALAKTSLAATRPEDVPELSLAQVLDGLRRQPRG